MAENTCTGLSSPSSQEKYDYRNQGKYDDKLDCYEIANYHLFFTRMLVVRFLCVRTLL